MRIEEMIQALTALAERFPGAEVMSCSDVRGDEAPKPIYCAAEGEITEYDASYRFACEGRAGEPIIRLMLDD